MACCLTAPSHYLDQYWLIISEVNFTGNAQDIYPQYEFSKSLISDYSHVSQRSMSQQSINHSNNSIEFDSHANTVDQGQYPSRFPGHQCIQRHVNNPYIIWLIPCLSWQFPILSWRSCHDDSVPVTTIGHDILVAIISTTLWVHGLTFSI